MWRGVDLLPAGWPTSSSSRATQVWAFPRPRPGRLPDGDRRGTDAVDQSIDALTKRQPAGGSQCPCDQGPARRVGESSVASASLHSNSAAQRRTPMSSEYLDDEEADRHLIRPAVADLLAGRVRGVKFENRPFVRTATRCGCESPRRSSRTRVARHNFSC